MRAAAIDRFGSADRLTIHEMPVPKISAQEVLIAINTAGVGMWDVRARKGEWAESEEFPWIPGVDGSGTVADVGAQVKRFKKGDRVYSYSYDNPKGGFYAEYVAVAASKVARFPSRLDFVQSGAVPTIGLTALQGVDDALHVQRDERVIIHGASGNVGMMALQFAKARGARVLATASGKDGVDFVRRLGADEAVDGKREFDFDEADAVLSFAAGKGLIRCLDALRKGGRMAYPNGVEPEPRRRKGIRMKAYDATPGVREFARLERAIHEDLHIPIAAIFKLEDAADAHRMLEQGHVLGKIVLRV